MASIFKDFWRQEIADVETVHCGLVQILRGMRAISQHIPKHPKIVHCTEMAKIRKLWNGEYVECRFNGAFMEKCTHFNLLPLSHTHTHTHTPPPICVFSRQNSPLQFHQLHLMWCKSIFNLGDTLVMGYPKQAGYSLCECIAKGLNASSLVSNRLQ